MGCVKRTGGSINPERQLANILVDRMLSVSVQCQESLGRLREVTRVFDENVASLHYLAIPGAGAFLLFFLSVTMSHHNKHTEVVQVRDPTKRFPNVNRVVTFLKERVKVLKYDAGVCSASATHPTPNRTKVVQWKRDGWKARFPEDFSSDESGSKFVSNCSVCGRPHASETYKIKCNKP